MKGAVRIADSLDRGNRLSLAFYCQGQTGEHGLFVNDNRAHSASSGSAAALGAGKAQIIAQNIQQCLAGIGCNLVGVVVNI